MLSVIGYAYVMGNQKCSEFPSTSGRQNEKKLHKNR